MICVVPEETVAEHIIGEYIAQEIVGGRIARMLKDRYGNKEQRERMEGLILKAAKRLVASQPRCRQILNFNATCHREAVSKLALALAKPREGPEDQRLGLKFEAVVARFPKGEPLNHFNIYFNRAEIDGLLDVQISFEEPVQTEDDE